MSRPAGRDRRGANVVLNVAQVAFLHRDGRQARAAEPPAAPSALGAALRAVLFAPVAPPALPRARAGPLALRHAPVVPSARPSAPPCAKLRRAASPPHWVYSLGLQAVPARVP